MDEFKKLPHEFGYGEAFDYSTMERCRHAVFAYRTGQMYGDKKHNIDRFTPSQWTLIYQVLPEIKRELEQNQVEDDGW